MPILAHAVATLPKMQKMDDLGSCCRRQTPALPDAALLGREVIARRATESSRPAPRHEHSGVVIEDLVEVKELELLTVNEEPELVANDVEEPELPVATGVEDTELVTANEVEPGLLVANEVQEPELPMANAVEEPELVADMCWQPSMTLERRQSP